MTRPPFDRWEASTPEHGETDTTCAVTFDGVEIIEIRGGQLSHRKRRARRLATLLNWCEAVPS